MKKSVFLILAVSFGFFFIFVWGIAEIGSPRLKGPYLGQKPPGETPELFAPGIVSTDANEGRVSFSREGDLFLFARGNSSLSGILIMEQINGIWTLPELAPFSAGRYDWDFMLAPDDKKVFVSSGRPETGGGKPYEDYRIWESERSGKTWSTPRILPAPVDWEREISMWHSASPEKWADR